MFHFVCRYIRVTNVRESGTRITHLYMFQKPPLISRFISTQKPITSSKSRNFTVDYLIKSCGLSQDLALKASENFVLKSTTKPDSVLSLLKTHGFTDAHISNLITRRPSVLVSNADKILEPKFKFFSDLGITGPDLGKFVVSYQAVLSRSLEKQIIPSVRFLRSLLHTNERIAIVLKKWGWLLHEAEMSMGPNIAILRQHGVPEPNILEFTMMQPRLLCQKSGHVDKVVSELKKMGFCPSSKLFIHGMRVISQMKKTTWDAKFAFLRSFGWSEDELISMFKKQPFLMSYSVEKLKSSLDFLMKRLNWTRFDVFSNLSVIGHSLENRIIPRSSVLQILLSKGLLSRNGMGQGFRVAEDVFLKKYVIKHHRKIPELFEAYQLQMGTHGVDISSTNGCKTETL